MASAPTSANATATDNRVKADTGRPVQSIPSTPNVVTGYPPVALSAAPSPPPAYLHQLFRQSHCRNRVRLLRHDQVLLYRLAAAALTFFVVMSCIFFMLWLVLRPHHPQLQHASVTVSPLSTTNTNVSATCNVSILLTNPNKKLTAVYGNFELFLHYERDQVLLSSVQVPPFDQPGKNDTFLHAHLQISNKNVGKDVVTALKEDLDHGTVSFGVKIFALVRLESKVWRTRSELMNFYCGDVVIGFSVSNGSGDLLNPFEECQLAL